jgi:hypothetical protein
MMAAVVSCGEAEFIACSATCLPFSAALALHNAASPTTPRDDADAQTDDERRAGGQPRHFAEERERGRAWARVIWDLDRDPRGLYCRRRSTPPRWARPAATLMLITAGGAAVSLMSIAAAEASR